VRAFRFRPDLPGDKSITHRALLLGAMASGDTRVTGANRGRDCLATEAAVRALGARVEVSGPGLRIAGCAGTLREPSGPLDLGNAGTGLRLLLGVLAGQPFTSVLTGDASLSRRPVERVLEPLRRMGAAASAPGDHPPVTLTGGALHGIRYALPVPSAQVQSAVLLAGVQATGTTVVSGGGASRDHTERLLRTFGAEVRSDGDAVEVRGPCPLEGTALTIPGDPSAAVFYLVAAALVPGSEVTLEMVGLNPLRTKAFDIVKAMGAGLTIHPAEAPGPEPMGRVIARGEGLRAFSLTGAEVVQAQDELPALAVAAAFAEGTSTVRGAGELRVKESDRLAAVLEGLRAIGARAEGLEDGWAIEGSGGRPLAGGAVRTHGDHRIAMAFLVAGLRTTRGVTLVDPPEIDTSDPLFLGNLERLLETAS
jgi:3-phosphoshikimate 1-carboxyvinyltransferase